MTKQTCIIYVRVSTEEQKKKGYSIAGQIQECTAYAQRMGYQIGNIFADEGKSAKDLKRQIGRASCRERVWLKV